MKVLQAAILNYVTSLKVDAYMVRDLFGFNKKLL